MLLTAFAPYARAASARWNRWLRRSVRLYLALEDPSVDVRLVEDQLVLTEWQLMRQIVEGEQPTPTLIEQAQSIMQMAQADLLSSETEVSMLRREMTARQAVFPWQRAA